MKSLKENGICDYSLQLNFRCMQHLQLKMLLFVLHKSFNLHANYTTYDR
jgi:hypothetical protein